MIVESIELKNYRNYEELHMDLSPGTNILYGDNAQGKTNILESVYLCCTSKSTEDLRIGILSVFPRRNPISSFRYAGEMFPAALTCI